MTTPTLRGCGAYVPSYYITSETFAQAWDRHLASGIDRCVVPDGDEDTLTIGWEAAMRALDGLDIDPASVAFLTFATSTPPIDEEDLSVRLGSMLGVRADADHRYLVGSSRVGTQALIAAIEAGPWASEVGLVVVADAPRGRPDSAIGQATGAGGVAFVLDGTGTGTIEAIGQHVHRAPGERFSPPDTPDIQGLGVSAYDRDAYHHAVIGAVDALGVSIESVDAIAIQAPDGKRPYRVAQALNAEREQIRAGTRVHTLGDLGAASAPMGFAHAISNDASRSVMIGYGGGAVADAVLVECPDLPVTGRFEPTVELDYADYLRRRGYLSGDEPAGGGAYVSIPTWRRSLAQRHRLLAGRCSQCGSLAFPPAGRCPTCGEDPAYEQVALTGTGTVEAITTIGAGGAPPEFDELQARTGPIDTAIIALDAPDGDTVSAPMQLVDTHDDAPAVGDRVEAAMRRIYTQEGLPRYGMKMRPR